MKKNINILLVLGLISSCTMKPDVLETKMKCVIDSVEYHGIGQDNTLQTTPYWRIHLKENDLWTKVIKPQNVGDTVEFTIRKSTY
jgi:hypothetical protein